MTDEEKLKLEADEKAKQESAEQAKLEEEKKKAEKDKKIPYERFKTVNEENKTLRADMAKIEKEKTEVEKKRLEDEGKFKEAAELSEKKALVAEEKADKADKTRIEKSKDYEIGMESKMRGAVDVKDIIKLIDNSAITTNEDGTFTGITEAIEKLKEDKPYLFSKDGKIIGAHTNKPKGGTITTREELLKDPIEATKFKQEHPAEYDRIMKQ